MRAIAGLRLPRLLRPSRLARLGGGLLQPLRTAGTVAAPSAATCAGCGIALQSADAKAPGYTPSNFLEASRAAALVC